MRRSNNAGHLNAMNSALMERVRRRHGAACDRRAFARGRADRRRAQSVHCRRRHQRDGGASKMPPRPKAFITRLHRCCDAIRNLPVPVIARIQGLRFGAGLEIAAACDVRIAADDGLVRHARGQARHSVGHRGGAVADAGRLGTRARDHAVWAKPSPPTRRWQWGLVERVVPAAGTRRRGREPGSASC